jgi:adenine phosphoribosyltransferase
VDNRAIGLACPPMDLTPFIRDVPDFPKPGIIFKDITPLLGNHQALSHAIEVIAKAYRGKGITKVVGIESRGFIIAPPVALAIGAGFVPIRKPGKLPWKAIRESYNLEYGKDAVEIHEDSVTDRDVVLMIDDVLATGGTMEAAIKLVRRVGGKVIASAFLIDLAFLGGGSRIDSPVFSVMRYT